MIGMDFLIAFSIIIGSLIFLCYNFPVFSGCVILLILGGNIYGILADRREEFREKGIKAEVELKYPEMSDQYKDRIVRSVMKGADINDFSIEDGWLKRGQGSKAKYANSRDHWGSKRSNPDQNPLYAEETKALKAHYSQFKLSDAEIHELASLVYFNWMISGMEESSEELVVSLSRRGVDVLKRYSRPHNA